jgi:hypothetical protein
MLPLRVGAQRVFANHLGVTDEHYYQNIKTGSHSPKAKLYVRKHKAELSEYCYCSTSVIRLQC